MVDERAERPAGETDAPPLDPRFDPVFQRGFAATSGSGSRFGSGSVDARAASGATPGSTADQGERDRGPGWSDVSRRAARAIEAAARAQELDAAAASVTRPTDADSSGAERAATTDPAAPDRSEPDATGVRALGVAAPAAPESAQFVAEPLPPFWRNPFAIAIAAFGVVSLVLGISVLWWTLSPSSDSESVTRTTVVLRQLSFYLSVTLMSASPFSAVALLLLAALRWRPRRPAEPPR